MRNISFARTTDQIRDRSKTVTRRWGWIILKPGTLLRAVVKGMGLKKGETVESLGVIRVVKVTFEPLDAMTHGECVREGFPGMSPWTFVDKFLAASPKHKTAKDVVTRIEFEYVDEQE